MGLRRSFIAGNYILTMNKLLTLSGAGSEGSRTDLIDYRQSAATYLQTINLSYI